MRLRVLSIVILTLTVATLGPAGFPAGASASSGSEPVDTPPPTQFNEFYPDERPLSDCVSSLPKPDCGSEARGGWRQLTILGAVVAALGFIAWRIVAAARRSRGDDGAAQSGEPEHSGP